MTTEQGFRMSTSVGGVLTGRGADLIILDDPSNQMMLSLKLGAPALTKRTISKL
jgi:hypothetical protein